MLPDLARYGLLAGLIATANANRREYHMSTTWLPHLLLDGTALLLPDVLRVLLPHVPRDQKPIALLVDTVQAMVCDNKRYVTYVAPLVIGYLLSHPDFNIYKGSWGELNIAGFGLDALPHSATAFALTALVCDTASVAAAQAEGDSAFAMFLQWCAEHPAQCSGLVLAFATAFWELGEYRIHQHELHLRGDASHINMQWSVGDTIGDCLSNVAGWGLAMLWRQRKQFDRPAFAAVQ